MLIECVPNISEGRDFAKVERIVDALAKVKGVFVLHVDSGADANRSVITFAGEPDAVEEGAFQLIQAASREIDMREQKGAHPRIGATDVVPFIPLKDATMADCVAIAKRLGKRTAKELKIPVYLYEEAASAPPRRNLATVRQGEYEGLRAKLNDPEWKADFGGKSFNERAGAVIIGARKFLIAFNVNLNTSDVLIARRIAAAVRTSGAVRDNVRVPGRLAACKAIGWHMPSFNCAQVSMNLYDIERTGLHEAFTACAEEAGKLGVKVTGSELIGLVPKIALLACGKMLTASSDEGVLLTRAVEFLGLESFKPFKLDDRVIEFVLEGQMSKCA